MKKLSHAAAYLAILSNIISPAYATTINSDTSGTVVLNAGDPTLSITSGGNIQTNDNSLPTVSGASVSGFTVNVNSGNGGFGINSLSATDSSIYFTDALANITLTSGRIDGLVAGNDGTIFLENSRAGTNTVTIAAGTLLQNRWGGGGVALNYNNSVNDATLILNNSGSIAVDTGGSSAVRFNDSNGTSTLQITNNSTGIIWGNTDGMAVNIVNGGTATITNSGTISGDIVKAVANFSLSNSGIVTGDTTLTSGTSTVTNTGTITGDITLGTGSSSITDSAQITGNIVGGTGNLDIIVSGALAKITGNINLGTNSSSTLLVTDGEVDGDFTFGNTAQLLTLDGTAYMNGAISGTGNIDIGETASLELNSGTVTTLINGTTAGAGSLLIANGQSVTAGANIGGTRSLSELSLRQNAALNLNNGGGRSLSATNIYFDSGSSLTVGAGAVSGTMRGQSNGVGTVNFVTNNSLNSDVGVLSFALSNVNLSSSVTLNAGSHSIRATSIALNASSILNSSSNIVGNISMSNGSAINLASGATLGSSTANTVDSAVTAGFGSISTTSGTQTINSNIGQARAISAFNVGSGSTASIFGNISANTFSLGGTMDLRATGGNSLVGNISGNGSGTLVLNEASHGLTGNLTLGANDTLSTTITNPTSAGKITVSGAATNDSATLLKVAVGSATTSIGSTYTLIDGGTGSALTAISNSNINVDNNGSNHLGKYAFNSSVSGNDLLLSVSRYYVPMIYNDPSSGSAYRAILGVDSPTGELAQLQTYLDSNSFSDNQKADVMDSARLENDNAKSRTIFDNINVAAGLIGNRLNSIRSPGRSSGDDGLSSAVWAEAFGLSANQGNRNGYEGYAADTSGFGFGIDKTCDTSGLTVGLAAIYAHSKIKSSYSNKRTEIDNYQLNLYAGKIFDDFYVNGLIGIGFNQYDSMRRISIIPAVATAEYDGKSYVARAEIGTNKRFDNDLIFTPTLIFTAAKNSIDSYGEGGAGTLNIQAYNQSVNFFEGRVGSALSKNFKISGKNTLTPTVFLSYGYDFAGDRQKSTANFIGQTATFANSAAKISQGSLRAGFGAKLYNINDVSLNAEYSFDHRIGYNSHMGALRLRYNF